MQLGSDQARKDADYAAASRVLLDLRNALAHGGISYLDEHGQQGPGPAAMLAFAGLKLRNRTPVGLNVLRIREEDFFEFLMAWANWLTRTRLPSILSDSTSIPFAASV